MERLSKRRSVIINLVGGVVICFLLVVNFLLTPYPRELTVLGIEAEVNSDAVVVAISLNVICLVVLMLGWCWLVHKRVYMNVLAIVATVINVAALIYWVSFL